MLLPSSLLTGLPEIFGAQIKMLKNHNSVNIAHTKLILALTKILTLDSLVVARNIRAFKTSACLYSPNAWKQSGANALHVHGPKLTKCSKNNLSANIGIEMFKVSLQSLKHVT